MTREEAIRILDPEFVANEFAKYDEEHGIRDREHLKAIYDSCVLAVSALREQEERSKPKEAQPMGVREKLVELIESARYWGSNTSEEIAENLIGHGVTLQEWIPVTERLPEQGERVLATDGGFVGELYINSQGQWQRYNVNNYSLLMALDILWWMPLPEPPKGE